MKYSNKYKLLFISHDPVALQGHSSVLANAGYEVTNATLQQTLARVDSEHFDGVVLCHSLTSREAHAVLSLIRTLEQQIPVIQTYSHSSDPIFRFSSPSYHPEELLSVVSFAMQDRATSVQSERLKAS